jgi:hypothetical protein
MLRDMIEQGTLAYGDPPNIQCCDAGASTSSVARRVLEYWVKPYALGEGMGSHPKMPGASVIRDPNAMNWRKEPEFEGVDLTPDWAR